MLSCKGAVLAALAGSAAAFVAPQVISARRHPRLPPALGRAGRAPQLHIRPWRSMAAGAIRLGLED
jgi:hypothetical protein